MARGRLFARVMPQAAAAAPRLIQRGDIANKLIRRFGLKDRSPAPTLSPDIQPVVIVDDISRGSEFEFLTNRFCMGTASVAALVANNSHVALKNPLGSGVRGRVKQLWIGAEANSRVGIGIGQGTLTTLLSGNRLFMDGRLGSITSSLPKCELRTLQQVGAFVGLFFDMFILATTPLIIPDIDIILNPTDQLVIENQTLNASIFASFYWQETNIET